MVRGKNLIVEVAFPCLRRRAVLLLGARARAVFLALLKRRSPRRTHLWFAASILNL